jgi:dipeptidyl aminopeptidase/acylaminoacyl peptidase
MQFSKLFRALALTAALIGAGSGAAPATAQAQPVAVPPPLTLTRDGVAATDPAVAASLPRYLQSRSAHFVAWLADGSMLIATRFGDTRQIHRVRTPLGMREQVSFAPGGVLGAAARPYASDAFVYLAPHGNDTQLFLQRLDTHALLALTDGSDADGTPVWAADGKRIAFTSNRGGGGVYLLDTTTPGALPRLVAAGNGHRWRICDWSADQQRLLLGREPDTSADTGADTGGTASTPAALYIADIDRGTVVPVGTVQAVAARFAGDGRGIVVLTRQQRAGNGYTTGQYLHLSYVDFAGAAWRQLSAPVTQDVQQFDQSADGRYLAYTLDDAGRSRLMLLDQQLKLDIPVTTLPPGIISSVKFDASGRHLALTLQTSREPADVYVYEPQGGALTRWTHSEVGPIDTRQSFVQPQRLNFSTWDQVDGQPRQLAMWVYTPGPAAPPGPGARPVVIWLCSGGGSQCRPRFAPFVQYLVNDLGCVVIAPNVRGSSGSSLELQQAGDGALRDDATRDIGSLLVWIGLQPGLDRTHVALLGEGYGGNLALASLAAYGDRLQGAVAAFPTSLTGLPNVLAIRRPVLLVQGLDDPAVPAYQAAQLREGLRAQGVMVQYLAAGGEGREFSHRASRNAYHAAAASFLARLLRIARA